MPKLDKNILLYFKTLTSHVVCVAKILLLLLFRLCNISNNNLFVIELWTLNWQIKANNFFHLLVYQKLKYLCSNIRQFIRQFIYATLTLSGLKFKTKTSPHHKVTQKKFYKPTLVFCMLFFFLFSCMNENGNVFYSKYFNTLQKQ